MQANCDPQQTVKFEPPTTTVRALSTKAAAAQAFTGTGGAGSEDDDSSGQMEIPIQIGIVAVITVVCVGVAIGCWICLRRNLEQSVEVVDVSVVRPKMRKGEADIEAPRLQSQPESLRTAANATAIDASDRSHQTPQDPASDRSHTDPAWVKQWHDRQIRSGNDLPTLPTPSRAPCSLRPN